MAIWARQTFYVTTIYVTEVHEVRAGLNKLSHAQITFAQLLIHHRHVFFSYKYALFHRQFVFYAWKIDLPRGPPFFSAIPEYFHNESIFNQQKILSYLSANIMGTAGKERKIVLTALFHCGMECIAVYFDNCTDNEEYSTSQLYLSLATGLMNHRLSAQLVPANAGSRKPWTLGSILSNLLLLRKYKVEI